MQKKMHLLFAMMMLIVSSAMAQITTSGLSGKVTAEGEEVIGAHIIATHKPSGTTYTAVTNIKGQYTINGMRVGGPYEIKATYIGFETKTIGGITLVLGETYRQDIVMNENAQLLNDVIITGNKSKFSAEKTGASTNISNEQMINMPTVNRSITDFTRLSPYGGNGMTFQGSDGRTANFTVDGANFNNDFGLSSALPGGGNPISIEAIEEMQVVISPFDVRQSGFIGGGVNAITKSGTNTFKGSAYVYHQNENLRGDAIYGDPIGTAREKDRLTTYGFTFGGPIVKDKLFFFVNGEMTKKPTQVVTWRASENGLADPDAGISRTTLADLKTVSDFVKEKYGYDTGSYTSFPADESNYKLLARLDWNITNKHHLALRYNFTKNRNWTAPNASSMDGGTRMSGARTSQYSMSYANSMYSDDRTVHSFSFDLNSRLTDNLSNQFLATYTDKNDPVRASTSDPFPFIDILKDDQAYISLGYELFTWKNSVHTKVWNIKDDITWYIGTHKVTAGVGFENQMALNRYMRNGTGYYRYTSLEDFLSGAAPEIVNLTYGYDGETEPAARVRFNKGTFYVQDDWDITDRFKLTYGIRLDGFFFNNADVNTNHKLLEVEYPGHGYMDTGKWPNTKITYSPRVGFTWDVLGDKSLKVRGGTGLFTGRLPLVFFTNMPTNSGMVQYNAQINAKNAANKGFSMSEFAGGLVTDANGKPTIEALYNKLVSLGYPTTRGDGTYSSGMCGVDPNFKMPQVWKTSLAIDYQFPTSFPLSITAEGIFNKTINAATIDDWSVPSVAGFARFNGVDNRAIYHPGYQNNSSLYVLSNTSKGYGWSASLTLNARPSKWVDFMASYTRSVFKELTSLPGSSASSVLQYIGTVDGANPNNIQLHDALNSTPHRFIAALNLHDKCCNHYSIIYETWNGSANYSYMLQNDMNGDGTNYDLIYIPTDEQVSNREFRFVSADDQTRFMDYVHGNSYLSAHQGEYAGTYAHHNPFVHRIDFSYKHDFQVNWGNTNHKLQLSFDMKNVLNLFNSSWGVQKYANPNFTGSSNDIRILKYEGVDADGYATFSTPNAINGNSETFTPYHSIGQCWYASIGAKYFFEGDKKDGCGCKEINVDNDAINALRAQNAVLKAENDALKNRKAEVQKIVEEKNVFVTDKVVVEFAQNSAELTDAAKALLNQVKKGATVTVVGATSPEGTVARNSELSVERANAVAEYLKSRGVNVVSAEGNEAGRVAIVTIK